MIYQHLKKFVYCRDLKICPLNNENFHWFKDHKLKILSWYFVVGSFINIYIFIHL